MKKILLIALLLQLGSSLYAISATGYGHSAKEAKDAALSELSNIVISDVKSKLSSSTTVTGGKVIHDAKKALEVSSNTYFQGVTYSDAIKGSSGYEVTATLSQEATLNTLNFIKKELDKDLAKLSKSDLKRLIKMSEMGFALANFSDAKRRYQDHIKVREAEVLKYLSYGQLFFRLKPKDAKLIIDNERYEGFRTYLLPAKSYRYQVSADGYHAEEGKFYLNGAKKKDVTVTLVKKSSDGPSIYLDIDKEFESSAKAVFAKYGIDLSDDSLSTNAIRFRFKTTFVTQVDDIKVYNLLVTAEALRGNKSVMLKRAKIKNVTDSNLASKKAKGVSALAKYLMKKLDMDGFKGTQKVDYSKQ